VTGTPVVHAHTKHVITQLEVLYQKWRNFLAGLSTWLQRHTVTKVCLWFGWDLCWKPSSVTLGVPLDTCRSPVLCQCHAVFPSEGDMGVE
jgi:hypothetical protein